MSFKIKTVKLAHIDRADDTYRITTATDVSELMISIRHVGLLNPPLLLGNNSEYKIISGFRRIEACCGLGWSCVEARLLDPETTRIDCAKLAITDNALQRPLNLIETSRSIGLISAFIEAPCSPAEAGQGIFDCKEFHKFFDSFANPTASCGVSEHCSVQADNAMDKELSVLGLPGNQSLIKKIKKICHLSQPIQRSILSNTISLAMAMELDGLTADASTGFVELFENLKLSLNKQREVVNLVKEIASREDLAVMEVLRDKHLQEILNHADLDRNQKARKIRSYLKKRRFPAITSAERAFYQLLNELKLGSGTKLTPPDNFEGSMYTLTMNFNDLVELKDRQATFNAIIQNPALEKILGR